MSSTVERVDSVPAFRLSNVGGGLRKRGINDEAVVFPQSV